MMDPAVKTAMAFCVLLAGVCAAMLFRRDPAPAVPNAAEPLLIRPRADMPAAVQPPIGTGRATAVGRPSSGASARGRATTVVTPFDRREPPPTLADSYPETDRPVSSRWGMSMDMVLPTVTPGDEATRSHKIVDGDTLAALAERYLGSVDRAKEIYEANRNVLANPELLPIGAELKIPLRAR
jgi:nucleoid-associated protein YgaU